MPTCRAPLRMSGFLRGLPFHSTSLSMSTLSTIPPRSLNHLIITHDGGNKTKINHKWLLSGAHLDSQRIVSGSSGFLVGRTGRDGRLRGPRAASWATALRPCRNGPWGLHMRRDARVLAALLLLNQNTIAQGVAEAPESGGRPQRRRGRHLGEAVTCGRGGTCQM